MNASSTSQPTITGTCPSCFEEAKLSMCSRCGDIYYCSKICQATDWPIHKLLCEKLAKYQNEQRPGPDEVRVVIFPADRPNATAAMQRPRFAWIKKLGDNKWDFGRFFEHAPEFQGYCPKMSGQTKPIATQGMLVAQSRPWMTQPVPNRSIHNLGMPGVCFNWMGDVIVVANEDINLRDFRAIVDWFQCHVYNKALLDPKRFRGEAITGVKANCKGEMARYGIPELQQVVMTPTMAMNAGLRSLGYLDNVVSLSCSSPDPHSLWVIRGDDKYYFNRNSVLLMLDSIFFMDYIFTDKAQEDPLLPTGSLIFLRDDGERLRVQDFYVIQSFVMKRIKKLGTQVEKATLKQSLAGVLTREDYEEYLESRE